MLNSKTLKSKGTKSLCSSEIFENRIWLRTEDAARYLSRSKNAIRILVSRGYLPVRKFRRRLYFKRTDLDALINTSFYH